MPLKYLTSFLLSAFPCEARRMLSPVWCGDGYRRTLPELKIACVAGSGDV